MTRTYFDRELESLEGQLLRMGVKVCDLLHLAVDSLVRQDLALAEKIIKEDDMFDQMDLKLETDCIKLIALRQPLAKDLRVISTVLKTSTDLERIADHCVNIAEITLRIGASQLIKPLIDIPVMAEAVEDMVRAGLKAFVDRDSGQAKTVCLQDDTIDHQYEELFLELTDLIRKTNDWEIIIQIVNLLFVARFLERVGDHATNIGERVIYLVTGEQEKY
ncbi:MAG TPA: phosphate transport system regulatory protein PhoU [Firmicutes bacterium]|mgnify:CR=1 FL=1|jgi:phosphate transport system protein|nr:phosphate transport system regulatory protein PhoU [Bacillota bacterium]